MSNVKEKKHVDLLRYATYCTCEQPTDGGINRLGYWKLDIIECIGNCTVLEEGQTELLD